MDHTILPLFNGDCLLRCSFGPSVYLIPPSCCHSLRDVCPPHFVSLGRKAASSSRCVLSDIERRMPRRESVRKRRYCGRMRHGTWHCCASPPAGSHAACAGGRTSPPHHRFSRCELSRFREHRDGSPDARLSALPAVDRRTRARWRGCLDKLRSVQRLRLCRTTI